jgi:hypothetical protein
MHKSVQISQWEILHGNENRFGVLKPTIGLDEVRGVLSDCHHIFNGASMVLNLHEGVKTWL